MPLPAPVTIADSPANKTAFTAGAPVRFAPACSCGHAGDNDTLFPPKLIQNMGSAASERRPLLPRANFLGVSVMTIGSRYRINEKQVVYQSFDEEVVALMLTSVPTTACGW